MWDADSIEVTVGIHQVIPSSTRSHVLKEETLAVFGGFLFLARLQICQFLIEGHVTCGDFILAFFAIQFEIVVVPILLVTMEIQGERVTASAFKFQFTEVYA